MTNHHLRTVLGCSLVLALFACGDVGTPGDDGDTIAPSGGESRYIAILARSTTASAEADTERLAGRYGFTIEATWAHALQGIKLQATPEVAAALASDPDVAYVEPDGVTYGSDICDTVPDLPECDCEANPDSPFCDDEEEEEEEEEEEDDPEDPSDPEDPTDPEDPEDPAEGEQITPANIPFVGGPVSATEKTAWVIDSGIDLDHPDLNVDVARSAFFIGESPEDEVQPNGHGTAVAGIIGAIDNDIGVVGVSPGNTVVSVRALDANNSGSVSGLVAAINHVVQNGAPGDVINMSVSAVGESQALRDAVASAAASGFLFAVSAGNAAQDVDATVTLPASINDANVFTVSAIGADGCLAGFSNFGASVDFADPGVGIISTAIGGGIAEGFDGTSFSAPHVAGLLLHKVPASRGDACNDPDGAADPIATF
jgi:Subtilase family